MTTQYPSILYVTGDKAGNLAGKYNLISSSDQDPPIWAKNNQYFIAFTAGRWQIYLDSVNNQPMIKPTEDQTSPIGDWGSILISKYEPIETWWGKYQWLVYGTLMVGIVLCTILLL